MEPETSSFGSNRKESYLTNKNSGNSAVLLYNENMKTTAKFPHSHLPMEDLLKRLEMLEKQNAELKAELKKQQELEAKLKWYEEQLRLLQHKRFGVSSEKIHPGQLELFNEVENESNLELPEPTLESIRYQRRRKTRGHREAMLENLPVETVEYRLPDEEQVCSCCGGTLHEMSTEVRQELVYIPAE